VLRIVVARLRWSDPARLGGVVAIRISRPLFAIGEAPLTIVVTGIRIAVTRIAHRAPAFSITHTGISSREVHLRDRIAPLRSRVLMAHVGI
jgi:hypothetical protein